MLTNKERAALAKNTLTTDYERAAEHYTALAGRSITAKYIARIISGERRTGSRKSKHDITLITKAVAQAVKERREAMIQAMQPLST
jgi:hypothetical protein